MRIKFTNLDKKIVLEGCNGDWAQKHYLPLLAQRAARGDIELWAVDIEPEIKLNTPDITVLWQTAQSKGKAYYLDKTRNKESYQRPSNINYVFIVTPDQYHCEIAEFWLEQLAPKGKIFIEKPLDAFIQSALKLKQNIKERSKEDAVFVFSHYLAKVHPSLEDWDRYLKQIGKVEKIKFHILESSPIPLNRAKTLNKGVIFDLFGHILTLSGALIERNFSPSKVTLQRVKLKEVKAAQYLSCPIAGETFSQLKFALDNTEVISLIGKGTAQDDKVMIVYGSNGTIKFDFPSDTFFVFNHQGQEKSRGQLNPRHVESFLEETIDKDKQPISVPGVIDFDAGIEILAILDEAKKQIEKMVNYQAGESTDSILERL